MESGQRVLIDLEYFGKVNHMPSKKSAEDFKDANLHVFAGSSASDVYIGTAGIITEAIIEYRASHDGISFQLMKNEESELYDIAVMTKLFYQA